MSNHSYDTNIARYLASLGEPSQLDINEFLTQLTKPSYQDSSRALASMPKSTYQYDPKNILALTAKPTKRKIFVSYHHGNDQPYYNQFSYLFHEQYEIIRDNSLRSPFQSNDTDYVMRQIREQYIKGTSCTIVLIGHQSHERKYLDWEIKATLDKYHGLIGILLPTHKRDSNNQIILPDRFRDNYSTGYAICEYWNGLAIERLAQLINLAIDKPKSLINNSRAMRQRNG